MIDIRKVIILCEYRGCENCKYAEQLYIKVNDEFMPLSLDRGCACTDSKYITIMTDNQDNVNIAECVEYCFTSKGDNDD